MKITKVKVKSRYDIMNDALIDYCDTQGYDFNKLEIYASDWDEYCHYWNLVYQGIKFSIKYDSRTRTAEPTTHRPEAVNQNRQEAQQMDYELYYVTHDHIIMQDRKTGTKYITLSIEKLDGKHIYSGESYDMSELAPYVTSKQL